MPKETGKRTAKPTSAGQTPEQRIEALEAELAEARRGAEEARAQARFYHEILQNVPGAISVKDEDDRWLFVNRETIKRRGAPEAEFYRKTSVEMYGFETGKHLERVVKQVFETGKGIYAVEGKTPSRDGYFHQNAIPLKNADGAVESVLIFTTNMTQRQQVQNAYAEDSRRARENLVEQNKFMHRVLDTIPAALYLKDKDGRYTFVNKIAADRRGVETDDIVGSRAHEIFKYSSEINATEVSQKVLTTGEAVTGWEFESDENPGTYFSFSAFPVHDSEGAITHVLSHVTDITERKRAENKAARHQELLQTVIDHIPYGVSLKDPDQRYAFMNKQAAVSFGYEPEECVGKLITDLISDDLSALYVEMQENVLRTREPEIGRERASKIFPGRYYSHNAIPIFKANGDLEYILTITINITDQKTAELALAEQKELLQILIDNIPAFISLRDASGKFLLANNGLADAAGVTPADMIGKTNADVYGMDQDDIFEVLLNRVYATGEPSLDVELHSPLVKGAVKSQNMIPIKNAAGAVEKVALISTDITARKHAEAELARHRDRLAELVDERTHELRATQGELVRAERLAAIGQLTATVSHELRNPLGTIRSSFYAIQMRLDDDGGPLSRAVARIDRNIMRCTAIIEELLDYTRARQPVLQTVDLKEWGEALIADLNVPAGVTVQGQFAPGILASIDANHLWQAVVNLIQNGWQAAMERHGENGARVAFAMQARDGGGVEIRVADNGAGIPPDKRQQIFEPLFSTKVYGVGLGLPLVHQIIEMNNGHIRIDDAEGGGAVFTIHLPAPKPGAAGGAANLVFDGGSA